MKKIEIETENELMDFELPRRTPKEEELARCKGECQSCEACE